MKLAPFAAILVILVAVTAFSGCFQPERKVAVTVGPAVTERPTIVSTPTPTPVPTAVKPTVTASSGTTTIKGKGDNLAKGIQLNQGVYVVSWSGSGTQLNASLTDTLGNVIAGFSAGSTSGNKLLVVDGSSIIPGPYNVIVSSDSDWTVTIAKPDTSSASSTPVRVGGSEGDSAVTGPFKLNEGNVKISYTFSQAPYADGHIYIYNVATGESFYTRPMTKGSQIGQSNADVPYSGVYIAQITAAPGSSYTDVTISQ